MTWFLDAALPASVAGPQESFALAWLAAICASVAIDGKSPFAREFRARGVRPAGLEARKLKVAREIEVF